MKPLITRIGVLDLNRLIVRTRYFSAGYRAARATVPQGELFYRRGGRGEPLLLLHGFGFGALETWQNQARALARRFDVIAPDLFYFGQSVAAAGHDGSPRAQAAAMVALLEKLRLPPTHVIGISFGGFVALEMALLAPERLGKLVLVDAGGLEPGEDDEAVIKRNFPWADDMADIVIPPDIERLKQFLDTVFHTPQFIPHFALREILEREFWRESEARRGMLAAARNQLRSADEIAAVPNPTLVAWGRHDPLLPLSFAERFTDALPDARLEVFERSGHVPMLEEPTTFNNVVTGFLQPAMVPSMRRLLARVGL